MNAILILTHHCGYGGSVGGGDIFSYTSLLLSMPLLTNLSELRFISCYAKEYTPQ